MENTERIGARRAGRFPAWLALAGLGLALAGCVTDTEFLAQNSSAALSAAEARGGFELGCDGVQSRVLSQKVVQGAQGGYGWRGAGAWAGPWTEYTVGVSGCGKRAVYMVVCRDESACNAFSQTARVID